MGQVFKWIERQGGLVEIEKINQAKSEGAVRRDRLERLLRAARAGWRSLAG